jgi:hypothetical protein
VAVREPAIRASDADREQVAERLRIATAEGRLQPHELEERLTAAFAARTYGELEPLVADLPAAPPKAPARTPRGPVWVGRAAVATFFLAILAAVSSGGVHRQVAAAHSAGGQGPGRVVVLNPVPGAEQGLYVAVALLVMVAMGLALCAAAGWLYTRGRSRLERLS